AAIRGSIEVLVTEMPSVTLLLRVRGNSEVERAALSRRRHIDAAVARLVADAQDDGALRGDLDPTTVARLIFGTVNSLTEWYRADQEGGGASVADAVCGMVFDGLRNVVPSHITTVRAGSTG